MWAMHAFFVKEKFRSWGWKQGIGVSVSRAAHSKCRKLYPRKHSVSFKV